MITWTDSAKDRLETYFSRLRTRLQTAGADPVEVTDDLRRHIDEEVAQRRIHVVTIEDVDHILARIGAPEPDPQPPASPPGDRSAAASRRRPLHLTVLIFGVILPALTLAIELATRMCAVTFFDPIPTVWHVLLVVIVPATNLLSWLAVRGSRPAWLRWLGWANGFALGVAFYFTLLYLPLVLPGVIAILFLGWGLLPLSPVFSFASTWRLRVLLARRAEVDSPHPLRGLGWGLGGAAVLLAIIALPVPLTRFWSHRATSDDPATRLDAVRWLRAWGHHETMLADCYGSTRWNNEGPFAWNISGQPVGVADARNIYYRVTGQPFNTLPPPQQHFTTRNWAFLDEFSWDPEQAGTAVGGRVKGLSLLQSRLDGLTNPDEAWGYVEWTIEFKNVATLAREARAQIALPPGGAVSRLTLWVNGEEREAAFAGSSQVRAAYEQVVKVQRRDPVLVTSCGPDRVLMQCFPVPANGGTIKVRLGITVPLVLERADEAVLRWPHFLERNFSVPKGIEHSLWIESRQPLQSASARLKPDHGKPGVNGLRGLLLDSELADPRSAVRARRNSEATLAWVTDPHGGDGQIIRQSIRPTAPARPGRVVFVLDGAKAMTEFYPQIAKTIVGLPDEIEFSLLLARDGVVEFSGAWRADAAFRRSVAQRLEHAEGAGGQDNMPALLRAWDVAADHPSGVIVWIHGPQPLLLDDVEALRQRFEWRSFGGGSNAPSLYVLQTMPGPNRILEKLNGISALRLVPRFESLEADLGRLIGAWRGGVSAFEVTRERVRPDAMFHATRGQEGSKHLARLWAFDEVLRLMATRQTETAIRLAGQYQLVTPVSGAVVLETQQQFQQAGLKPVDAQTVPTVPEPGTLLLMVVGTAVAWTWRKKIVRTR
jgi:hypothetical protein